GADRIAGNSDVANKIGTYQLAVLARHHGIPFIVAAPRSTIDFATPTGAAIVVEDRPEDEVLQLGGRPTAPRGSTAANPAFDVTPVGLVHAIVTEYGVISKPSRRALASLRPSNEKGPE